MPNLMPVVNEWYECIKERDVPQDGFLNPSNCSLKHLNIDDKGGAVNLKDKGKKNEQRM